MPKFENSRPIGVLVSQLELQVRDAGSNPALVHFHSSCARLEPPQQPLLHWSSKPFNYLFPRFCQTASFKAWVLQKLCVCIRKKLFSVSRVCFTSNSRKTRRRNEGPPQSGTNLQSGLSVQNAAQNLQTPNRALSIVSGDRVFWTE